MLSPSLGASCSCWVELGLTGAVIGGSAAVGDATGGAADAAAAASAAAVAGGAAMLRSVAARQKVFRRQKCCLACWLVGLKWFEHWLGEFSDRSVSVGYVHNFDLLFRLGGWFSLWLSSRFVRCTHMTRNKYKSCGVQEWIRRVPKVCAGGLNYARAGYARAHPPAIVHVLDFAYKHSNDVNKA